MRGFTLLFTMLAFALVAPGAAQAQQPAHTGGAEYSEPEPGATTTTPARPVVPGNKARRLDDGTAAAPADAPPEVQEAIWAANEIVGKPYAYGGGHNRTFKSSGYDCSGTVSYALNGAGLLKSPLDSGSFMSWGKAKKGQWITVYANSGHAWAIIAGLRWDTSGDVSGSGPRWHTDMASTAGFIARHPSGY